MGNHVETTVRVRFADTDADGGVYFANYLTFFSGARHDLFREVGINLRRLADEDGQRLLGVEVNCRFRSMAYFDDLLTVRVRVERLGNTSLAFSFEIVRPDENGETLIATGGTTQVVVDRQNKPVTIPPWMREALS
ncbi:MAG: thioesterase family protein [Dehalococcoidia bacterium]|nr:thioesterase family protein [Dehalococcoidia bacterium]